MPSAQLNFLIPCKWELQVCQLSRVWQAYWLHENWKIYDRFSSESVFDYLAQCLLEMEAKFEDFIKQLDGKHVK